ncbi:hypothetical protein jhhlp_008175 [Lomentospora prolificans]|uniref:Uncharacterized protein n=1 Tax=Lomentospora prolificans TaxID=41688 RepID=A0A2N3MZQ2_9PEZI|nr:hypothetical protein jhhlp_008175 [Lomentospora prolificans]
MKISLGIMALWLATVSAQNSQECTKELANDIDCADVINPTACYNMFRFRNAQTLQCIEGTDNVDRARKACKCCSCIGTQMCSWVQQNRICTG